MQRELGGPTGRRERDGPEAPTGRIHWPCRELDVETRIGGRADYGRLELDRMGADFVR